MASEWIKMRVWICRDPKVIAMAAYLHLQPAFIDWMSASVRGRVRGQSADASADSPVTSDVTVRVTVTGLVQVWGVTRPDGVQRGDDLVVEKTTLETLDAIAGIPCFGQAMALVGWAVEDRDGHRVTFPKFFCQNASTDELRKKKDAERKRLQRAGNVRGLSAGASADSPRMSSDKEKKRTEHLSLLDEEGEAEFSLKCLEGLETQHLSATSVLVGFHRAAHREQPEKVPATERTLLRLIGCAVQASSESKRSKLGLFAWMVTHPSKARVNGDSTKRARALLAEHRSWIAAERAAGREVNPNVVPLPDAVEANGVPA